MLAYQQQHQQQAAPSVASQSGTSAGSYSVAAVPPASAIVANSKLRFGNTGIASWTINNDPANAQNQPSPKSFGAVASSYRLHTPVASSPSNSGTSQPLARSHQASRGNDPNLPFTANHWQNYHKHYNQQLQMRLQQQQQQLLLQNDASVNINGGFSKGRSVRRVPNASDMNKQWRAPPTSNHTSNTASTATNSARETTTTALMSSTFQDNNASMLSGLSLALNKGKLQTPTDTSTSGLKVSTPPLFDIGQQRTPYAMSPAESMKTPGYVDPDSLPFELGSEITDTMTGKKYKLLSVLGEGSYAVVYLARCNHDGAKYALKCLSKLGLSARQLSLQRTELEIHASVCPHPHIVTLYAHFETRDWLFLVMERVAGPDLYDYITQHPAFNANQEERRFVEATRMFEQMIDAVAHIHALKAYHRDLKPENFILGADGNLKLTDFGLATRESLSTDFECGSKPYMSYENRNGGLNPNDPTVYGPRDDYSPRLSDVWALGVLFLNLLFAQSPWTDPSRESCFKFCRFQREGAGFLVSQFPKLPREVADFLVTRVFSPESGRCNVLELKQWVQDLDYPFSLPKPSTAVSAPRPIATRHSNKTGVNGGGARRINNVSPTTVTTTATAAAGTFGKSHGNSGSVSKKWWPGASGALSALPKLYNSPQAVDASTALAFEPAAVAAASPGNNYHSKSPHVKKQIYGQQQQNSKAAASMAASGHTQQQQQSGHLSTSVPAHVFSQIIPATQAAAARKMMPREFNHTAAKAAAAILQSSMMGLPKNGLGQGKEDYDGDAQVHEGSHCNSENEDENNYDDENFIGKSSADYLEDVFEVEEEDSVNEGELARALAYSAAAADVASKFPKQPAAAGSLGFSLSMQHPAGVSSSSSALGEMDEMMEYLPVSSGRNAASSDHGVAKSSTVDSNLRSLGSATVTASSTIGDSSYSDDEFDVLGHFSDASSSGEGRDAAKAADMSPLQQQLPRHQGHDIGKVGVHSASRVRFSETPQQLPSPVLPMAQGRRSGVATPATTATNSANSSLTATLVTSSVEYYSPHIKSLAGAASGSNDGRVFKAILSETTNSGDVADVHANYRRSGYEGDADGGESNWRKRKSAGASIASESTGDTLPAAAYANSNGEHTRHWRSSTTRAQNAPTSNIPSQHNSKHHQKQKPITMHSMPAPFKHFGARGKQNKFSDNVVDTTAFSWADDVEELPIPSLSSKMDGMSMDYGLNRQRHRSGGRASQQGLEHVDEDALSDDYSWIVEDEQTQQNDYLFHMDL
ncbi:hypothetical protein GGI25_002705 [Coemansia spiralis]|uniref:Protein kinase domain-containing protein n=2 Tax=Coemansia TaxID=4863 RepID=A0A9W8G7X0_9FUNG|nr:hypothetical protein EDC05_002489 [Coemansia umbellata]KAJ2622792.1 hypothetical protein GGI26_002899 [Coemansia sp. RSA 1358]KAJ2678062.1 hypothetical protein GGI25_002705 [Coemansia spiralis]